MFEKSKLLAAVIAAAAAVLTSGPVLAVDAKGSLYGDIRWSLDYTEDNDPATTGPTYTATDNNSNWGVKASTTQRGITVFGAYERFIDTDVSVIEFTRQAYAGVQGGFGTVKYGKHNTAYADAGRKLDPFYNTAASGIGGVANAGSVFGAGNSHGTSAEFNADFLGAAFVANHLSYDGPSFFGVTGNVAFFMDETNNADQDHNWGAGAEYDNAGITAGVQFIDENNGTWLAVGSEALRAYGGYAASRFGAGVSYERHDLAAGAIDAEYVMVSGWFGVLPTTRIAASAGMENESGAEGTSVRLGVFHDVIDNFTVWAAALHFDEGEFATDGNFDSDVVTLGASYKFDLGFSTR
jgi:hypothetical protein